MKHSHILTTCLLGIALAGCMYPSGRPDYTGSGALAGGATGAILGSMSRHPEGALIGGAIGAVTGGIIGHGLGQAQEDQLRSRAPQTYQRVQQGTPLSQIDIKELTRAGVSDDLIISQIRNSRTIYHLGTNEIIDLKNSGVSERVIDFMIHSQVQPPTDEVAGISGSFPPSPRSEPIIMCPGPGYFWVHGDWIWYTDRWVWHPGYWHRPCAPHFHGPRG